MAICSLLAGGIIFWFKKCLLLNLMYETIPFLSFQSLPLSTDMSMVFWPILMFCAPADCIILVTATHTALSVPARSQQPYCFFPLLVSYHPSQLSPLCPQTAWLGWHNRSALSTCVWNTAGRTHTAGLINCGASACSFALLVFCCIFSWNRLGFLLSHWYCAVFWIQ